METAPGEGIDSHRFRVTHPFHPLQGQEFEAIAWRRGWPEDRVYFVGSCGNPDSIPVAFTDLGVPDPFVVISAGRSHIRLRDWIELADLVEELKR